jgi:molybdopterin/thiamine biosynthesis adenylyltransferase
METVEQEIFNNIDVSQSRFSDAPWFEGDDISNSPIMIGGAGGIGSWTALLLSRVGFPIYLYDDDVVERVNLAGQFYKEKNIGYSKVEAVRNNIIEFSAVADVMSIQDRITEDSPNNDYMISCFDNMKARKTLFDIWVNAYEGGLLGENPLFIDGRMEAEVAQIYFVEPNNIDRYRETLFDDSAVPELNCSYKSTSHNGAVIGGYITTGFLNHMSNIRYNSKFRSVPFCIDYQLPSFGFYKTT